MADYLLARNQTGTFVLSVRAFKTRTPQKIIMVKIAVGSVPTAGAAVAVKYAVRRVKLTNRQRKPADEHDGNLTAPGQPTKAGRKTYKKVGMF